MKDIVCWFSGGITSALACKLAIDEYGEDRCRVIFIDTSNEDEDTYRFLKDCEVLYNLPIETIKSSRFGGVEEVWDKYTENVQVRLSKQ